jgi:hypothetical protein
MGWLRCDIDVSVSRFALASKDESVGRALGSSVRTVRRMIGSLSVRLDAGSRFELGVRVTTVICLTRTLEAISRADESGAKRVLPDDEVS